jgi:hypothetical protein
VNVVKNLGRRRLAAFTGSLVGVVAIAAGSAGTASAAPLFPQCPPVGSNQGCSQLIVVKKDGTATVKVDPAAPKNGYDGVEDTLIGVQNNSGKKISSINLASTVQPIMAFDGDGLCNPSQWPSATTHNTPPGCPGPQGFGSTGYEGPRNSFSNISLNKLTGTVNFKPALQPGGSSYFALEEALQPGQLRSSQKGPIAGPVTVRGNFVSFDLTCVGSKKACKGLALLIKGKKISFGRHKINIPPGFTSRVKIKLNGKGRKYHKRHKHFKIKIVVKLGTQKFVVGKARL